MTGRASWSWGAYRPSNPPASPAPRLWLRVFTPVSRGGREGRGLAGAAGTAQVAGLGGIVAGTTAQNQPVSGVLGRPIMGTHLQRPGAETAPTSLKVHLVKGSG